MKELTDFITTESLLKICKLVDPFCFIETFYAIFLRRTFNV